MGILQKKTCKFCDREFNSDSRIKMFCSDQCQRDRQKLFHLCGKPHLHKYLSSDIIKEYQKWYKIKQ